MISGILREVWKHEEIAAPLIPDTDRPSFRKNDRLYQGTGVNHDA